MKKNQPQHCAHVAEFYMNKSNNLSYNLRVLAFGLENNHGIVVKNDGYLAELCLKKSLMYLRKAIAYWKKSGGQNEVKKINENQDFHGNEDF